MTLAVTALMSEEDDPVAPLLRSLAGSHDATEAPETAHRSSNPMATVLVVDDDEGVRESLVLLLDTIGYAVLQAADGAQALRTLRQHHVDALVLDIAMPRLDGLAVLEAMGPPPPRVVVYSALEYFTTDQIRQRAVGGSVTTILRKPCAPTQLIAAIGAAVDTPER